MRIRFPFTKRDMAIFAYYCPKEYSASPSRRALPFVKKNLPDWSKNELKARYDELIDFFCRRVVKMWNESPMDFEYVAVWRTSHLMHNGTDKDDRPWSADTFDCGDGNSIPSKDIARFFKLKGKKPEFNGWGFTHAFEASDAMKSRNNKQTIINEKIKAAIGNYGDDIKSLHLCIEPNADGNTYFIVPDAVTFELVGRVTDAAFGSPGEVDYWGGRTFSATLEDVGCDFAEHIDIYDVINALILDGLKPAKSAQLLKKLGKQTVSVPGSLLTDELPKVLWEIND